MKKHATLPLWQDCTVSQARGVLQRNKISGRLLTEAVKRFTGPDWNYGSNIYLMDTLTGCAALVINQGCGTYDVRIATRGAEKLLDDLSHKDHFEHSFLDSIIVMD